MAERKKIGIYFEDYKGNWTGGTYYIFNLIASLGTLSEEKQPIVKLYADNVAQFEQIKKACDYPYIEFLLMPKLSLVERAINKCWYFLFKKGLVTKGVEDICFLFPNAPGKFIKNQANWIPDFQEYYLKEFFSKEEIESRARGHAYIAKNSPLLILSSNAAKLDFEKFYPDAKPKTFVLSFAVHTSKEYEKISQSEMIKKYSLPENYFFSPNQFWQHKNHKVILMALKLLKERGSDIVVAFSGKEHDYRSPNYTDGLKSFVATHGLESNVHFLGFIDRNDQLKIMKSAIAVIQPSRFEGWSTVVEDVKSMSQFIVASNIEVHKEQLKENALFFNPDDEVELARILEGLMLNNPVPSEIDYSKNKQKFATDFMGIVEAANKY